jgi:phospholipase C
MSNSHKSLKDPKSTPPYGNQTFPTVEKGSLKVRGAMTEGRYLVFRTTSGTSLQAVAGGKNTHELALQSSGHKSPSEVFVIEQYQGLYSIKHLQTGNCINASNGNTIAFAACPSPQWKISYNPNGATYQISHAASGKHFSATSGKAKLSNTATSFHVYSVSY